MLSRLLSLELGRSPMINDEDCEVELPTTVDDVNARLEASWNSPNDPQSLSPFPAVLCVSREISSLLRITRLPSLSPDMIQDCDLNFNSCMATFPAHHQFGVNEALDPRTIAPIIYLQNARLLLHRHNLTAICPPEIRSTAVSQCVVIAQNTAQLLSRCLADSSMPPNQHLTSHHTWESQLVSSANALFCTHIWRCTLFLCFRADFQAALTCARVSAIIGDARPINTACGIYIDFFLNRLTERMQHESRTSISSDEELIAYVSGDLQGRIEHSWVWHGSNGFEQQPLERSGLSFVDEKDENVSRGSITERKFDTRDWGRILERLNGLAHEHEQERRKPAHGFLQSTPEELMHLETPNPGHNQGTSVSSSRISIADIM